jgi:hypothetical protein
VAREENTLQVLLHVATTKTAETTHTVEDGETFVGHLQLLQTVQEVLRENLGYLLTARAHDEPLEQELLERTQTQTVADELVVEQ